MRLPLLALTLALVGASPASAAFDSCTFNAGTVTATYGSGTVGELARGAAGAINADGVQCGTATVTNTDTIVITGDSNEPETLNLRLDGPDGGQFAPGVVNEAGSSDEIEFQPNLGTGSGQIINVIGSAGADNLKAGVIGGTPRLALNLNAGEADGRDVDLDLPTSGVTANINGAAGNDTLSDGGGFGTALNPAAGGVVLDGGADHDDITVISRTVGGPGNDTYRFPSTSGSGTLTYAAAPGPVTLVLADNNGGATTAGLDGFGGTDTIVGEIGPLILSPFDHHVTALTNASLNLQNAGDGADEIQGGSTQGSISGRAGNDVLRGGGGTDNLSGGDGDDQLYGEAGADGLLPDDGEDLADGGPGDDAISDTSTPPTESDDFFGGEGRDLVQYSFYRCPTSNSSSSANGFVRTAGVTVDLDDVADDGAPGEGDNVHSDVEDLQGTRADDTLIGDGDANHLTGYNGRDTLRGNGGDDRLEGMHQVCSPTYGENIDAIIGDTGDDLDGGDGADVINGRLGDDTITSRDAFADTIDCGAGTGDVLTGDLSDVFSACETASLGNATPPADTTPTETTPTDTTPAATTPAPPPPLATTSGPVPPPTSAAALPTVTALVDRPATKKCVSRRRLRLRVRRAVVAQVRSVTVVVNGKRKPAVTGGKLGLPVDLRGLPKGSFTVRLDIVLTDGRKVTDTRRYKSCAPRKKR